MGIADVKNAFAEACAGKVSCIAARLRYEDHDETQFQRLEFDCLVPTGEPFTITSDRVRPDGSLIEMARATAARAIEYKPPPKPTLIEA